MAAPDALLDAAGGLAAAPDMEALDAAGGLAAPDAAVPDLALAAAEGLLAIGPCCTPDACLPLALPLGAAPEALAACIAQAVSGHQGEFLSTQAGVLAVQMLDSLSQMWCGVD